MKAIVWHDVGDIRLDDVPEPTISDPQDAIVEITTSAICGTDLHMVRGTLPGMAEGRVLGHEGVGVVRAVGPGVRNLREGDRVVIPSTVACGSCSYCRASRYSQCDVANPGGRRAGTTFFGGPESAGGLDGMQAELVRVPHANIGLVRVPDAVSDDQAIMISDVFPTAWFGARLAEVGPGDTVAVFGAGPVGLFAVVSALRMGAARVIVVDGHEDRLRSAGRLGAETVDFNVEDPVETLVELTGGIGPDRVIEAVGIDAESPATGPAKVDDPDERERFTHEMADLVPPEALDADLWRPGDAPTQAARWAVTAVAKAGTIGIVGVYPPGARHFSIGEAMMKGLTLTMGNAPHRRDVPHLLDLTASGLVDPATVLTQHETLGVSALEAYESFDRRDEGWVKTVLTP